MTAGDPRPAGEAEYLGPCIFCHHPAPEHDVDGECWVPTCDCGTGEDSDPQNTRPAASGGATDDLASAAEGLHLDGAQ